MLGYFVFNSMSKFSWTQIGYTDSYSGSIKRDFELRNQTLNNFNKDNLDLHLNVFRSI